MSAPSIVPLGIDISKASFDVLLLRSGKRNQRARFNNTPAEFEQFQQWLQTQGVEQVHACLEATNIYGHALASYLHQQGHIVSIVNPARIKGYAQSQLSRTKNEALLNGGMICPPSPPILGGTRCLKSPRITPSGHASRLRSIGLPWGA